MTRPTSRAPAPNPHHPRGSHMSESLEVRGVDLDDLTLPEPTPEQFRRSLLHHLQYTVGTDPEHASKFDWRMALSFTIRDRALEPWFDATRRTWDEDRKRVYYLSMEFLIGRLLEDATINLGLRDVADEVARPAGRWTSPRSPTTSPTRHSATADSAGSRPASSSRWRRSAARRTATASATSTACSASASRAAARSRRPRTGCVTATRGSSPGPSRPTRCGFRGEVGRAGRPRRSGSRRAGPRRGPRHPRGRVRRAVGQHAAPLGGQARPPTCSTSSGSTRGDYAARRRTRGLARTDLPRALPQRHHLARARSCGYRRSTS